MKVILFHLEQAGRKTESSSCFDVTMGRHNGAELYELIGIFTQSVLQDIKDTRMQWIYLETMDL